MLRDNWENLEKINTYLSYEAPSSRFHLGYCGPFLRNPLHWGFLHWLVCATHFLVYSLLQHIFCGSNQNPSSWCNLFCRFSPEWRRWVDSCSSASYSRLCMRLTSSINTKRKFQFEIGQSGREFSKLSTHFWVYRECVFSKNLVHQTTPTFFSTCSLLSETSETLWVSSITIRNKRQASPPNPIWEIQN